MRRRVEEASKNLDLIIIGIAKDFQKLFDISLEKRVEEYYDKLNVFI